MIVLITISQEYFKSILNVKRNYFVNSIIIIMSNKASDFRTIFFSSEIDPDKTIDFISNEL